MSGNGIKKGNLATRFYQISYMLIGEAMVFGSFPTRWALKPPACNLGSILKAFAERNTVVCPSSSPPALPFQRLRGGVGLARIIHEARGRWSRRSGSRVTNSW
jgi:hypothetical protein